MVLATRRGDRRRQERSRRIWNRNVLEWAARGKSIFLVGAGRDWMLMQVSYRKIAYGSQIPRPSTVYSRVLVICTKNQTTLMNCLRRFLIEASSAPRVSRLSYVSHSVTPKSEIRRRAQTTKEGHGSCIRSRRIQGLVPLFRPVFKFSWLLLYPYLISKLNVKTARR